MTRASLLFSCLLLITAARVAADTTPSVESDILTTAARGAWQVENLGAQITTINVMGGVFGPGADGRTVAYVGLMGEPAQLAMVDAESGERLNVFDIPGAAGNYDMLVSKAGVVYLPSHSNGNFYRYRPGASAVENLGRATPDTTFIWELAEGEEGKIYGACYPKATLFEYDPATEKFRDMGPALEGEDYARSILYHPKRKKLYIGIGSHAALMEIDPATGEKRNILPEEYRSEHFVYSLGMAGDNLLIARMDPSNKAVVLNLDTDAVEEVLPVLTSNSTSDPTPDRTTYYTGGAGLMKYQPGKGAEPAGGSKFASAGRAFLWARSADGQTSTLRVLLSNGQLVSYSPETDKARMYNVDLPKQPIHIHNMIAGPDGKIYSSGYVIGNLGVFDPATGEHRQIAAVKQSEGMTNYDSRIYFGTYPRARISVLDTSKPVGRGNPTQIFTLDEQEQDRPFGMLAVPEEQKVFIGTVPGYGLLGGALAIYDPVTTDLAVHRDLIPKQSIVTFAYKDGILFGGTSISGGLGKPPEAQEGVLFLWDVKKGEKVFETVPVAGKQGLSGLRIGPDGNVWGWAEGTLFIFDPKERKVIYSDEKLTTSAPPRHFWRGGYMLDPVDGIFYGMLFGNIYRLDVRTRELEVIARGKGLELLTRDEAGRLYFVEKDQLMRLTPVGGR